MTGIYDVANQIMPGVDLSWIATSMAAYPGIPRTVNTATFYIEGGGDTSSGNVIPSHRDAYCGSQMTMLRAAGVDIAYYVPTANGSGHPDFSYPPTNAQLKAAIDAIKTYYPEVNVIFVDEVGLPPSTYASVAYITNYAVSQGFTVDINPGGGGATLNTEYFDGSIPYRLCMSEVSAVEIEWDGYGTLWPDNATNDTTNPPNYTDSQGNQSYIPTPSDVAATFNSQVPINKRILDFYLSVPWESTPYFDDSWLTEANVQPYATVVGWMWIALQGTDSGQARHNALAAALSTIFNPAGIPGFQQQSAVIQFH